MGFFIIFLITAAILIIYLFIIGDKPDVSDVHMNAIIGCVVVSLIGVLFFGLMLGLEDTDDKFMHWLGDREDCERNIETFNERTDYYKFRLISDIKENNEELETALKYHDSWLLDGLYSDYYIHYEPLEIPKVNLNSRQEEMN